MHVDDIFTKAHAAGKIPVSFEMFPPKGELTLDKARDAARLHQCHLLCRRGR